MTTTDTVKLAVKPLEWRDPYLGTKGYISVEARSVVSRYEVYCAGTGLRWAAESDNKPIGVFDTEAEAKASCQADPWLASARLDTERFSLRPLYAAPPSPMRNGSSEAGPVSSSEKAVPAATGAGERQWQPHRGPHDASGQAVLGERENANG